MIEMTERQKEVCEHINRISNMYFNIADGTKDGVIKRIMQNIGNDLMGFSGYLKHYKDRFRLDGIVSLHAKYTDEKNQSSDEVFNQYIEETVKDCFSEEIRLIDSLCHMCVCDFLSNFTNEFKNEDELNRAQKYSQTQLPEPQGDGVLT